MAVQPGGGGGGGGHDGPAAVDRLPQVGPTWLHLFHGTRVVFKMDQWAKIVFFN